MQSDGDNQPVCINYADSRLAGCDDCGQVGLELAAHQNKPRRRGSLSAFDLVESLSHPVLFA